MHVRRGTARLTAALLLTAGAMLVGPSALAQDADPCAPAADGSVPEMCQGGMAPEPAPAPEEQPTDPTDPCPPQPVEPGDGVVTDGGDQGVAVGEPNPGSPVAEGEVKPEPAPDEPVSSTPGAIGDDGIICAFGAPVSAPVDNAAGSGVTGAPGAGAPEAAPQPAGNGAVSAGQLPRTGPKERLAALAALGAGLLLAGAGASAAGRRRITA